MRALHCSDGICGPDSPPQHVILYRAADHTTGNVVGAVRNRRANDGQISYAGYQWVVGIMFVAMFPINILLRTLALATSQLLLAKSPGDTSHPGVLLLMNRM